jgi:hypothetical protein
MTEIEKQERMQRQASRRERSWRCKGKREREEDVGSK